jgi:hypothetical protein
VRSKRRVTRLNQVSRLGFSALKISFIYLTPCMHPKKSVIFQGTRCIPLSFKGEGEGIL